MGANKGAAALYSFTSSPDGAPDAAAAPRAIGGARGPPRTRGRRELPPRRADGGAEESRPVRSGERAEDRQRRENSGVGRGVGGVELCLSAVPRPEGLRPRAECCAQFSAPQHEKGATGDSSNRR